MGTQSRSILFGIVVVSLSSINIALSNLESDALLAQASSLVDPNGVLASWDKDSDNPCQWFHVHCDDSGHVIILDLSFEELSGSIVSELGHLKSLRRLFLNNNNLTGGIPGSLSTIPTLTQLDLSCNDLCGEVTNQGSFKSFTSKSFAGNPKLCGPMVQRMCGHQELDGCIFH